MTADLIVPAEVVEWVRLNAPKDMPEHVLPTLALFVASGDDTGRGAHASLNAVATTLGITPRKASRNVELLRDAGLLVLVEPTDPEVLAKPVHERPKVYDLGGALRVAMLGPERGVTGTGRGDTVDDESDRMGAQGPAPDQTIPKAAHYIAAEEIVRELYRRGADFYGEPGSRMRNLVANGLNGGWDQVELVKYLDKAFRCIFKPADYLLFLMELHPTPPWSPEVLYRNDPVPAAEIAGLVDRLITHMNKDRTIFDLDQVVAARDLINAALATGMTSMDLMLLLEEPTTWPNAGAELLARVQAIVPARPRPPASTDRQAQAAQPTTAQTERRLLREGIARMHSLTFDEDQARTLDNFLRVAILNGITHPELLTIADRPLSGLDYPVVELVERYRGLEARR